MKKGIQGAVCCNHCAFVEYYYEMYLCHLDKTEVPDVNKDTVSFLKWIKEHEVEVDTVCDDFEYIF